MSKRINRELRYKTIKHVSSNRDLEKFYEENRKAKENKKLKEKINK